MPFGDCAFSSTLGPLSNMVSYSVVEIADLSNFSRAFVAFMLAFQLLVLLVLIIL